MGENTRAGDRRQSPLLDEAAGKRARLPGELLASWRDIDPTERQARLRSLQAIVRLIAGQTCPLVELLRLAECDSNLLAGCDLALGAMPTVTMRRVLCSFAETLPPTRSP